MSQENQRTEVGPKSAEGAEIFVDHALKIARGLFGYAIECELPQMPPHAVFLVGNNPETGEPLPPEKGGLVHCIIRDFDDKDLVAEKLRAFAATYRAMGVAFITEAWMVELPPDAQAENYAGSLERYPDRIEILAVSVEHIALGKRMYRAKIRHTNGLKTLDEFDSPEFMNAKAEGRFIGILPEFDIEKN